MDSGIGAEVPIRSASQDRLRRSDFAERIACVLSEISPREGRVFAIRGGWGFGKSSLKNLVTEKLDVAKERAGWLDFNPWQWGDSDAIARALFGQIADRLGGEHSRSALARAEALRRYGAILMGSSASLKKAGSQSGTISMLLTNASVIFVASAIGFDLPTVATVAVVFATLSICVPLIGRVLSFLGRDRSSDPLDRVREALEVRLRELACPLVIFVDDIDRLEPEQIRMLLRQVKANANLPNIVFVLLFQSSIVEKALDPVADGGGRAFLEKIVQVNFDLPAVPVSTVHRIFGEELSELAGGLATEANGFSEVRWGNVFVGCIQPLVRNLRDARRLISSIAVHMPLHVSGTVFEVNIIDFLALEALRVFEPNLHEALFRERTLVLQESRYRGDNRRQEDSAAAERLLEFVTESRRPLIKDVISDLFPAIGWAYGGASYGSDFHREWLNEKRVCSRRYFPRYFELQTGVGEISEYQFVLLLDATANEDRWTEAIADIDGAGLLPSLAARFDEAVDRLPVDNAAVLLPGMFQVAQKLAGLRGDDPFGSPWVSAWRAISWFLKRIPNEERESLAIAALRKTEALSVASIIIHLSDPADQKEGKTFDPALSSETVEAMKLEWLRLIRSRAANVDELIAEPDLLSLLFQWEKLAGALDEPQEWVCKAIQADEGFAIMATRLISRGRTHSSGDRVSTIHLSFDKETVDRFIGIDVAKARCEAIRFSDFPEHQEALQKLKESLEKWLGLRAYDFMDL
ncbi:P-loop NTPase fold protein [Ectopseudomonas toyotomiensis]|uniref:KAP family NTPase n=1 Tax=Ectopseudomonas toyotomiensis TaxID=554344 RepID=A0AA42IPX1_9GAMM|nr:P-loop NTPase fold protein [Pseudomonas toyotomiensis]MDH0701076.1 KAP family NTPase [Pseudomonas toyotomiensis]